MAVLINFTHLRYRIGGGTCGQDLVEYGLLASLVSVAAIAGVQLLGISVGQLWTNTVTQLVGLFGGGG